MEKPLSARRIIWAGNIVMALAFTAASLVACTPESTDKTAKAVENVSEQAERRLERAAAVFDDATITAKVKTALLAQPQLKGLAIDVDTSQNVVSLNGSVDSDEARTEAARVASQVAGVREVKNNLHVKKS